MGRLAHTASLLLALVGSASGSPPKIVCQGGTGDFTEIQPAIDVAEDGNEVLVRPGEYLITEPITFRGKAIVVRSEAGAEETTVRMAEEPTDPERASVVVFESGEGLGSVLEGFTLTAGKGTVWGDPTWAVGGGGILCRNGSSPHVANCTIVENYARHGGGGVSCVENSSPLLLGCTITRNSANGGAGLSCSHSAPRLEDCLLSGNEAREAGGGLNCALASPELHRCTVSDNTAEEQGAGICSWQDSTLGLTECVITNNRTDPGTGGGIFCREGCTVNAERCQIVNNSAGDGAGVYCADSSVTMVDCLISGNMAEEAGGGVACGNATVTLTNCALLGNSAAQMGEGIGGGVCCWSGTTVLSFCTLSQNRAAEEGGGIFAKASASLTVNSCILWANTRQSLHAAPGMSLAIEFSCVEGDEVLPGEGNINRDPMFCEPGHWEDSGTPDDPGDDLLVEGDYRLSAASPCLGTGRDGSNMGAELGICEGDQVLFRRGDANADDNADLSDAVFVLNYLFIGGPEPSCQKSADCDNNGELEVTDAVRLLGFLFMGGPAPESPFPGCGIDSTEDELTCEAYPYSYCE